MVAKPSDSLKLTIDYVKAIVREATLEPLPPSVVASQQPSSALEAEKNAAEELSFLKNATLGKYYVWLWRRRKMKALWRDLLTRCKFCTLGHAEDSLGWVLLEGLGKYYVWLSATLQLSTNTSCTMKPDYHDIVVWVNILAEGHLEWMLQAYEPLRSDIGPLNTYMLDPPLKFLLLSLIEWPEAWSSHYWEYVLCWWN